MKKKLILLMMLVTVMFVLCSCSEEKAEESEEQAPIQNANDYINSLSSDKGDKEDEDEDEDETYENMFLDAYYNEYSDKEFDDKDEDMQQSIQDAYNDQLEHMKFDDHGTQVVGDVSYVITEEYIYSVHMYYEDVFVYMTEDMEETVAMISVEKNGENEDEQEMVNVFLNDMALLNGVDEVDLIEQKKFINDNNIEMTLYKFEIAGYIVDYELYSFTSNERICVIMGGGTYELSDAFYDIIQSVNIN